MYAPLAVKWASTAFTHTYINLLIRHQSKFKGCFLLKLFDIIRIAGHTPCFALVSPINMVPSLHIFIIIPIDRNVRASVHVFIKPFVMESLGFWLARVQLFVDTLGRRFQPLILTTKCSWIFYYWYSTDVIFSFKGNKLLNKLNSKY